MTVPVPASSTGEIDKTRAQDLSESQLRSLGAAGDKKAFVDALWRYIAAAPEDPNRLAYAASLADIAGANNDAVTMYSEFKKRFPRDLKGERIDKLVERLKLEELECPEAFVDQTPERDFYLVDTVRKHIVRWTPERMPIKVCIHESSSADATPPSYLIMTKQLFEDWAKASGGALKISFIQDPKLADIDVMWTKDRLKSALPGKQGVTTYEWKGAAVSKAKIVCLTVRYLSDSSINERSARHVAIHEIGHALGLGHSKNIHDCMYFGNMTPDEDAVISDNDSKMLNRLYSESDETLEAAALGAATKYRAPEKEMIAEMLHNWAEVAGARNNLPQAEILLKKEKEIYDRLQPPVSAEAIFQNNRDLSRALRQQNKYAEAIPYYLSCLQSMKKSHADDKDLVTVYQNLSACQRNTGRYAECKATCLDLLPLLDKMKINDDAYATVCMQLGTLSFHEREFDHAEHYYKEACDSYNKLHISNADSVMAQQNYNISLEYKKTSLYRDRIELPFSGQGSIEDWHKGNDLYREAIRASAQAKPDEAIAKYNQAISVYPYDSAYYFNLGSLLLRQHRSAEATPNYAKASELNPQSFSIAFWYGVSAYGDKSYQQARAAFEKANQITHSPDQDKDVQKYLDNLKAMGAAQ